VNYILEHALRWHVTSVNLQSSPIPANWKADFESFQKKKWDTGVCSADWNIPRPLRPRFWGFFE